MIIIKSQKEIELMREAGKIVAETHEILKSAIIPGIYPTLTSPKS